MSAQQDQALRDTVNKTLLKFLYGFINASKDYDPSLVSRVSATLHPDCTRRVAPASFFVHLGAPTDLVFDNKTFEEQYAKQIAIVGFISVDITHTVVQIQPGGITGSARTIYVNRFTDGTEFTLDMAWFLKFTPDGTQITEIQEFIDSLGFIRYHEKIDELMAKSEKKD